MEAGQTIPKYRVTNLTNGLCVASQVRVASSSAERRQGLMGVGHIPRGTGLWISPCEAIHTFGMKTAIDAYFLDGKFRVKKLIPNLLPRRISICLPASSVLELEAGSISRSSTRVGDTLYLEPDSGCGLGKSAP